MMPASKRSEVCSWLIWGVFNVLIVMIVLALAACSTTPPPATPPPATPQPDYTLDVYLEDAGWFVISERSGGDSMGVRFNVSETHTRKETEE